MFTTTAPCLHQPAEVAGVRVVACAGCGTVEWSSDAGRLDPAEGLARLFGRFELVARLPAIRAPGPEVLMYRAPGKRARAGLEAFPPNVWLAADDDLWLSHDGEHLLLVPTTPLLMDNLTRGA